MANSHEKKLRKARKVSAPDKIVLCGGSAGRCAMCNDVVIEHHLTGDAGNFSQAAHIWAFSEEGPRGDAEGRPNDPDTLANLIFLCTKCHKLVDDNPDDYLVESLVSMRDEHYERVRYLTDCIPSQKAHVITLSARIAGQTNTIKEEHIREAVRPLFPFQKSHAIGFDPVIGETPEQLSLFADELEQHVSAFLTQRGSVSSPVAIFAIAPMPLLIKIGRLLGNKVDTRLFQLHRDTQNWNWKSDGEAVTFEAKQIRQGEGSEVALLVNVSGSNGLETLPESYGSATVYEIRPTNIGPERTIIRRPEDLANFRVAYREALTLIASNHRQLQIGVFPAVAIPCAIAMGLDLLPKADPKLFIHDWRNDHFIPTITV